MSPRRLRALGDAAHVVDLGEGIDPSVNARVRALDRALAVRPCPGLLETVPAYATLLVRFDPRLVAPAAVAAALEERLADSAVPAAGVTGAALRDFDLPKPLQAALAGALCAGLSGDALACFVMAEKPP